MVLELNLLLAEVGAAGRSVGQRKMRKNWGPCSSPGFSPKKPSLLPLILRELAIGAHWHFLGCEWKRTGVGWGREREGSGGALLFPTAVVPRALTVEAAGARCQ